MKSASDAVVENLPSCQSRRLAPFHHLRQGHRIQHGVHGALHVRHDESDAAARLVIALLAADRIRLAEAGDRGQITFQDLELETSTTTLQEIEVVEYKVPLMSKDQTTSGGTVTSEEI